MSLSMKQHIFTTSKIAETDNEKVNKVFQLKKSFCVYPLSAALFGLKTEVDKVRFSL